VNYLKTTKVFAANDTEKQMLECYMESFTTGSIDGHKNGSRHWIKNKLPAIET
jgi:dipeptidyl-peptidase-3